MRAGRPRRWIAGAVGLAAAAAAIGLVATPAGAATTVNAQLSLSGVATATSPVGGSTIGIHPGDSVSFAAATAPTAGLEKLGLSSLLTGLSGGITGYQVVADFSHLPGGAANTTLGYHGRASVTFTFAKTGTYDFTWTAKSLQLLGLVPISLDGNQLAKAGVKLNAANQYVGQVVVSANPPAGNIGVQLPSVGATPQVGPVRLPPVKVPGTKVNVPVTVPSTALPHLPSPGHAPSKPSSKPASSVPGLSYLPPGESNQDRVMPPGYDDNGGAGLGPNSDLAVLLNPHGAGIGVTPNGPAPDNGVAAIPGASTGKAGKARAVDVATSEPPVGQQMPVLLAIVAIIALSLVTAAYARLYLLRRNP